MPPRSQLEIHTSSVLRLVKEEASYHREAVEQAERIKKLENDKSEDENREYLLQQEVCLPTPNAGEPLGYAICIEIVMSIY